MQQAHLPTGPSPWHLFLISKDIALNTLPASHFPDKKTEAARGKHLASLQQGGVLRLGVSQQVKTL